MVFNILVYFTQNQHFAEMFPYSNNTNYNLNFYYLIEKVSIYLRFHLFGNYSYVSDVSDGIQTRTEMSVYSPVVSIQLLWRG
jgi:hypothetical protein